MRLQQENRKPHVGTIPGKYIAVFARLLIGLASFILLPTHALAVVENITPFEWAMPDRLLENSSIVDVPEYDPTAEMIPSGGWTVNFDACGVTSSTVASYEWFIDGVSVATVTNCQHTHQFPEEGSYHVSLTVTDDVGDSAALEETIAVQDWLIIAMGDSYGSGEGNPIRPITPQAHIDFSALRNLATNVWGNFQDAADQLPGMEEARAGAQQLRDDAQATRDQAAADLTVVQQDLQNILVIQDNVENDPAVIIARNNILSAQQWVITAQADYNAALADYNNCTFLNCATRLAILAAAATELEAAQANLVVAEGALWTARTAAVVFYSAIASIQNFDALTLAIDSATVAVNLAQNTYNTAQNVYQDAQAVLQQAIDAVASLTSVIDSLQTAWFEARLNALTQYLESMPVWTAVAPSWGTQEPSLTEVVTDLQPPGDALRCHRSMYSGQARAALALEKMDPHTSVTLVHLSCSGATITNGLTNAYGAQPLFPLNGLIWPDGGGLLDGQSIEEALPHLAALEDVPSQIISARNIISLDETVPPREIDAVVISIGGNDIEFAGMIESCISGEPCHIPGQLPPSSEFTDAQQQAVAQNCNPSDFINFLTGSNLQTDVFSFTDTCLSIYDYAATSVEPGGAALESFLLYTYGDGTFNDGTGGPDGETNLEEKFFNLDNALELNLPQLANKSERIYLTQYPNPTGNADGSSCGWDPTQPTTLGEELKNLPGVTQPEILWADTTVAAALRDETARVARDNHGWTFISDRGVDSDTIGTASRSHGYCADDHWVVRIPESLITQGDHLGAVHPNIPGHDNYAVAIYSQLIADLYPAGVDQPPRLPEDPNVSNNPNTGGGGGGGGSIGWPALLMLILVGIIYLVYIWMSAMGRKRTLNVTDANVR